ncbi:MAG TPA: SCO family protein [Allosphingosinicella sp.]|nr:SCO family protein [Allosphingosinicella sp.]
MNESAASRPFGLLLLLLALILAGCRAEAGSPPLEGATMGGPFTLTGHDGRRISDSAFAGKYRLVYFGFTFCPDVCPVDLQTIGAGLRQFERDDPGRAARVQPLFISVDPARDTPEVLRRYVAAFHPRLIGLTGSEAEIARVARAYGVFFERGTPSGSDGYSVDHSRMAVLYGPEGQPIAIVPHDQGPAGIAAELDRWVR